MLSPGWQDGKARGQGLPTPLTGSGTDFSRRDSAVWVSLGQERGASQKPSGLGI